MSTFPSASSLGVDARSLDALKTEAARDPRAATRQAAVQFESLFTQMVLKSMRDASPKPEGGQAAESFTSMLDAQFARQFAGRPGGLAQMIEKQLSRQVQDPGATATAATPAAAAAGAPQASAVPKGLAPAAADFMRRMLPHAREAEKATGVPASFILGQAALESGWGRCQARNPDGSESFNLFGIKAHAGWRGGKTEAATTEYVDGVARRERAGFRSYASYAEAFTDYARLLTGSRRYAPVVAQAATPEAFAAGMQRAGYATDPAYAQKLARTIHHAQSLQRTIALQA